MSRMVTRRAVVGGIGLAALAVARPVRAAEPPLISVNLQGPEGGSRIPGRAGTDFFFPEPEDFAWLAPRTRGPYRLPFRWERLQPEPGGPLDPAYRAGLEAAANAAARTGRAVILDCHNYMHRLVGGVDRTVDARDGHLTRAHFADLWQRTASVFKDHPGVASWDLMNEPQGLADGQDVAAIMAEAVAAIDAVETRKTIVVEGDHYSAADGWAERNPAYPLADRHGRIVYSAHCYPDADGSGTHFAYADLIAHGIPETVLVDRTRGFADWCRMHGVKGAIGETNVGTDDPRWLNVLDAGLAFWASRGLPVHLWLYARRFGANPYNLYSEGGVEAPQWHVVARRLAGS